MRLVAAHRTPLAESDGHAPSSSETRLRGKFFMLRDPVPYTYTEYCPWLVVNTAVPVASGLRSIHRGVSP
eukprot:3043642-Prymnesium_polylepis.1